MEREVTQRSIVEGVLLRKTLFKDKDLICSFLTRSGKKVSICFYGARKRTGKSSFSSLELGNMFKITLRSSGKKTNLKSAKEWETIWRHEFIAKNYKTYCYLCLMLEIATVVAVDYDEECSDESRDLFSLVSNGLFFLEKHQAEGSLNIYSHMFIYLSRLLQAEGIFPELSFCLHCEEALTEKNIGFLVSLEGAFCCKSCADESSDSVKGGGPLFWQELARSRSIKFEELNQLLVKDYGVVESLLNYLAAHEILIPSKLKSLSCL